MKLARSRNSRVKKKLSCKKESHMATSERGQNRINHSLYEVSDQRRKKEPLAPETDEQKAEPTNL